MLFRSEVDIGRVDKLVDFFLGHYEVYCLGKSVGILLLTVDNAGNIAAVAQGASGFLTDFGADTAADYKRT